jgi:predicted nucleic acid-binding protein
MRVALDTNILVYAEGFGDSGRRDGALSLLERLPAEQLLIPAQVLGELCRVMTGKAGRSPEVARSLVLQWADSFVVADTTWAAMQAALDLTVDHGLRIWDALILAVTAENHCRLLLSEDLHPGFTWRGVTVVNPYLLPHHPLLAPLLG